MRSIARKLASAVTIRGVAGSTLLLIGAACIFGATILLLWSAWRMQGSQARLYALLLAGAGSIWLVVGTAVLYRRLRGFSTFFCLIAALASAPVLLSIILSQPTRPPDFVSWELAAGYYTSSIWTLVGYGLFLLFFLFHLYTFVFLLWPERQGPIFARRIAQPANPEGPHWRAWLLNSLADASYEPAPDRFVESVLAYVALFGTTLATQSAIRLQPPSVSAAWWITYALWTVFWVLLQWPLVIHLTRLFKQARARSAERELLRPGSRRPILYLRTFGFDQHAARDRWAWVRVLYWRAATPEQILARELRRCGPVIALGRPGERLPELGAARFYASNERWRDKVADVVQVSQIVVCATGTGQGLAWELSHMIATQPPEKLVLWAHPHLMRLDEADREAEWTSFLGALGGLFPKSLPERLGDTRFIHFDSTFTPIPIGPQGRWWRQRRTVRALLRAKGLPKPDPALRAYRHRLLATAGASAAAVLLMGSGILRLADWLDDRARMPPFEPSQPPTSADALDSLTTRLVSNENADDAPRTLADHQELLRWSDEEWQQQFGASPEHTGMLRELAESYVQIFSLARQAPIIEDALYARVLPLFANLNDAADASARLSALTTVLEAITKFEQNFHHAFEAMRDTPRPEVPDTSFEARVLRRALLLEAEAAVLTLLAGNPNAWTVVKAANGAATLPRFSNGDLQKQLIELTSQRHAAFRELFRELYGATPPEPYQLAPDPLESLGIRLISHESADTTVQVLEAHEMLLGWSAPEWQRHFDVSPEHADMLRRLTLIYVQIFRVARQAPLIEEVLFANGLPLFANLNNAAEVSAQIKSLMTVSVAITTFQREYSRVHQAMKNAPPKDNPGTAFESRTARRAGLLEAEAAILRLLADNPKAWSSVVSPIDARTRVPHFSNEGLRARLLELADKRREALEQLLGEFSQVQPEDQPEPPR
jgi:hypothetical protein